MNDATITVVVWPLGTELEGMPVVLSSPSGPIEPVVLRIEADHAELLQRSYARSRTPYEVNLALTLKLAIERRIATIAHHNHD